MTPIKRRKWQKFGYRIFACKIPCHHYYVINFWLSATTVYHCSFKSWWNL